MNDLSEQNEVLVQTVEELEREANERVELLESKLHKTSGTHKVRKQQPSLQTGMSYSLNI